MAEFIKIGNEIQLRPNIEGMSYDLINGKVYDLKWNGYECYGYFVENGDLNMPKKLYKLDEDDKFIDRVLTYFNSENSGKTTGVMLAGTKGTGKTMLSKRIALESNLPIIVVDTRFPSSKLNKVFKEFSTPVCIIFDEIEKNEDYWETKYLLGFLDGVEANAKKLVLMTCNETNDLDDNIFDRCSRIRYFKEYEANSNEVFIRFMAEDKGVPNIDKVVDFIKTHIEVKSFDNISSFLDEILLCPNLTLEEIIKDMNLSTTGDITSDASSGGLAEDCFQEEEICEELF